jgi:hypothetical protein
MYKGILPPVPVAVAVPLFPPLHETLVCEAIEATTPAKFPTVTEATIVHAFKSVTVTE